MWSVCFCQLIARFSYLNLLQKIKNKCYPNVLLLILFLLFLLLKFYFYYVDHLVQLGHHRHFSSHQLILKHLRHLNHKHNLRNHLKHHHLGSHHTTIHTRRTHLEVIKQRSLHKRLRHIHQSALEHGRHRVPIHGRKYNSHGHMSRRTIETHTEHQERSDLAIAGHYFKRFHQLGVRLIGRGIVYHKNCK